MHACMDWWYTVGKPGICITPRDLNRAIRWSKYQMPNLEEALKVVLDAKDELHQLIKRVPT